jgi:hypothetical protein
LVENFLRQIFFFFFFGFFFSQRMLLLNIRSSLLLLTLAVFCAPCASLRAGVSRIDATLPVGVPLAGYNYPPRRVASWPVPHPTEFTNFMTPSEGVRDPTFVKCLILEGDGAAAGSAFGGGSGGVGTAQGGARSSFGRVATPIRGADAAPPGAAAAGGTICMLTLDAIGADAALLARGIARARARGFKACESVREATRGDHAKTKPNAKREKF